MIKKNELDGLDVTNFLSLGKTNLFDNFNIYVSTFGLGDYPKLNF